METDRDQSIEKLLESFFEGETSNAQEEELYRFFARKELPPHLERYRPLFRYFEKDIVGEATATELPANRKRIPFSRKWWAIGLSVAASVCLFFYIHRHFNASETDFNPYAGSYIIHNGVKTEIPEEVAHELYKAVLQAESAHSKSIRMAFQSVREDTENLERLLQEKDELEVVEQHLHKMENYEH